MHHPFGFDPSYGYDLKGLLAIGVPPEPPDFATFWQKRYAHALTADPRPVLRPSDFRRPGFEVLDLMYWSTGDFPIHGWLLRPEHVAPRRVLIVGHGYGGVEQPDFPLPCDDAVYVVPCFRGLARSRCPWISDNPTWHVLHDIDQRDRYVLGGCVEDLWLAVSASLQLHPELSGRIGYMGVSFGGGIGALALAWDTRLDRGHLNVPTFGHQPLRLQLPTVGSGASVQTFAARHPTVLQTTLAYYDAAVAARHIRQPMHVAAALFDPSVAPPGQFAVYNAIASPKQLFVLTAGHFDYVGKPAEDQHLLQELGRFFGGHDA